MDIHTKDMLEKLIDVKELTPRNEAAFFAEAKRSVKRIVDMFELNAEQEREAVAYVSDKIDARKKEW